MECTPLDHMPRLSRVALASENSAGAHHGRQFADQLTGLAQLVRRAVKPLGARQLGKLMALGDLEQVASVRS